eukprot:g20235.t1
MASHYIHSGLGVEMLLMPAGLSVICATLINAFREDAKKIIISSSTGRALLPVSRVLRPFRPPLQHAPLDRAEEAEQASVAQNTHSDHLTFAQLLAAIGFVQMDCAVGRMDQLPRDGVRAATGSHANRFADNTKLVEAVLVAGLYPRILRVVAGADLPRLFGAEGEVFLHPSSVLFGAARCPRPTWCTMRR